MFVIHFEQDKLTLRVPTLKVTDVGMRKLSDKVLAKRSMTLLKGKPRIKRTMWSRRAQEYEAKINSGDLLLVAEVVRDLYRGEDQPEQSYSERQLYEAALERMAREIAAVHKMLPEGSCGSACRSFVEECQGFAQGCRRSCQQRSRRRQSCLISCLSI